MVNEYCIERGHISNCKSNCQRNSEHRKEERKQNFSCFLRLRVYSDTKGRNGGWDGLRMFDH